MTRLHGKTQAFPIWENVRRTPISTVIHVVDPRWSAFLAVSFAYDPRTCIYLNIFALLILCLRNIYLCGCGSLVGEGRAGNILPLYPLDLKYAATSFYLEPWSYRTCRVAVIPSLSSRCASRKNRPRAWMTISARYRNLAGGAPAFVRATTIT